MQFLMRRINRSSVVNFLNGLPTHKDWVVNVTEKASVEQIALYWVWVGVLARDIGMGKKEMHRVLLDKFLVDERSFYQDSCNLSISEIDTVKMSAYMNDVQFFASTECGATLKSEKQMNDGY